MTVAPVIPLQSNTVLPNLSEVHPVSQTAFGDEDASEKLIWFWSRTAVPVLVVVPVTTISFSL